MFKDVLIDLSVQRGCRVVTVEQRRLLLSVRKIPYSDELGWLRTIDGKLAESLKARTGPQANRAPSEDRLQLLSEERQGATREEVHDRQVGMTLMFG